MTYIEIIELHDLLKDYEKPKMGRIILTLEMDKKNNIISFKTKHIIDHYTLDNQNKILKYINKYYE